MAWTECGTGGGGGHDARGDRLSTLDYSPSIAIRSRINFFMLGGLCRNVAFLQYAVRDTGEAEWQRALEIQTGTRSVNQDPPPTPPSSSSSPTSFARLRAPRYAGALSRRIDRFEQRGRLETLLGSQCCHDVLASSPRCLLRGLALLGFWFLPLANRVFEEDDRLLIPIPVSVSQSCAPESFSFSSLLAYSSTLPANPARRHAGKDAACRPPTSDSLRAITRSRSRTFPTFPPPSAMSCCASPPLCLRTDRHPGGADAPAHCHPGSLFDHTELKLDTASKQEIRRVHPFVQAYLEARTEGKGEDKAKKDLLGSSSSTRLIDWISERR